MTVELLNTLSIVAYVCAGVMLLISVALFFLLDVPKLYGEISGRTAKKAIEEIKRQSEGSGVKREGIDVRVERRRYTDKITSSGRLERAQTEMTLTAQTEKFATNVLQPQGAETTVLQPDAAETTVLESANETTVLGGETTVLSSETTVLSSNTTAFVGETTVLGGVTASLKNQSANFFLVDEVGYLASYDTVD